MRRSRPSAMRLDRSPARHPGARRRGPVGAPGGHPWPGGAGIDGPDQPGPGQRRVRPGSAGRGWSGPHCRVTTAVVPHAGVASQPGGGAPRRAAEALIRGLVGTASADGRCLARCGHHVPPPVHVDDQLTTKHGNAAAGLLESHHAADRLRHASSNGGRGPYPGGSHRTVDPCGRRRRAPHDPVTVSRPRSPSRSRRRGPTSEAPWRERRIPPRPPMNRTWPVVA